jgi:hypothetical protein
LQCDCEPGWQRPGNSTAAAEIAERFQGRRSAPDDRYEIAGTYDAETPEAFRKAAKHNSLPIDNSRKRRKDRNVNGHEPSTPRAALGLTAVAMAAITMGALVVLPAKLDTVSINPYALAAATEAPIEVVMSPACIGSAPAPDH